MTPPDPTARAAAVRNKQVYKITWPNGKIYVGVDVTGRGGATYFGSPSAKAQIVADLGDARLDFTVRKQILWESEAATDTEARAMEIRFILETRANDPAIGYNRTPRFREVVAAQTGLPPEPDADALIEPNSTAAERSTAHNPGCGAADGIG